jgi:hypothetical protein
MQTEIPMVNTIRENIFSLFVLPIKKAEAELLVSCKLLLRSRHSKSSPPARREQKIDSVAIRAGRTRDRPRRFVEMEPLRMESTLRASSTIASVPAQIDPRRHYRKHRGSRFMRQSRLLKFQSCGGSILGHTRERPDRPLDSPTHFTYKF